MSMYKDYVENQSGNRFVFETDFGFITYNYQEYFLRIEEVYVKPEARRQGNASLFYEMMDELAKERELKTVQGTIIIGTNGSEESLLCFLKNGFKLQYTKGVMIFLIKELGE